MFLKMSAVCRVQQAATEKDSRGWTRVRIRARQAVPTKDGEIRERWFSVFLNASLFPTAEKAEEAAARYKTDRNILVTGTPAIAVYAPGPVHVDNLSDLRKKTQIDVAITADTLPELL